MAQKINEIMTKKIFVGTKDNSPTRVNKFLTV